VIGVTIGVGPYREMAKKSAAALSERTGLRTIILGDGDYCGTKKSPPHHLKFKLFKLIDDDDILYFDADLVCVEDWCPQQYAGSESIVAVRDFWFLQNIAQDAKRLGIAARDYFNSGFLILNRRAHQGVLSLAENLLRDVAPTPFRDQSHLNLAARLLEVPVRFLDRRYNWIDYRHSELSSLVKPVNCHFNLNSKISAGEVPLLDTSTVVEFGRHIRADMFSAAAGLYTYERVGKDRRALVLAADGTVGWNAAQLELYWFPFEENARLFIALASRENVTCVLEERARDWVGNWLRFEKMPTILHRRGFH